MSKKRILVTGAFGQIGTELVPSLWNKYGKENVVALGHHNIPSTFDGIVEKADANDAEELKRVAEKYDINTIYHLISLLSAKGEADPSLTWRVNMDGLKLILDMAVEKKMQVFWPSSIAAFGPTSPREKTPQKTILEPTIMYGVTKVTGELLCQYYYLKHGLDVRSVRYPGLISSKAAPGGGTTDYAVAIFYDAIRNGKYTCFVNEDTVLPMMYMDDAIEATIKLMEADPDKLTVRTSYNLAAISFSVKELAKEINKHLKVDVTYKPDFRQQIADSWPKTIDDSVARKDWGWQHKYDLSKMTKIMLDELQKKIRTGVNKKFTSTLSDELKRIDEVGVTKRTENIIEGFTAEASPKALINGKKYRVFNSNDYLGLRFDKELMKAEEAATKKYGSGPGAVRFISGSLKIHRDLERAVAKFHGRDDAMIFSSAFAANIAVMSCVLNKQSKDSLLSTEVVVISDSLNHRSIIDGIRAASIEKTQKKIYNHLDYANLAQVLEENKTQFKRAVIVTDGIFSMLGEYADLGKLSRILDQYDSAYEQGVLLVVDDSHGVGAFGENGRGCEDIANVKSDLLVGTFGKGFGADGGYVVGDQVLIDYLRESAATYIYSNPVSAGTAAAALAAITMMDKPKGKVLGKKLAENITYFKTKAKDEGFVFAADSIHPIQPLLIGDTLKTKQLKDELFKLGFLVTNINYPVVAKGKDEIRIQINASHSKEDIDLFIKACSKVAKKLQIIS